jgi:hypothetical protein
MVRPPKLFLMTKVSFGPAEQVPNGLMPTLNWIYDHQMSLEMNLRPLVSFI